MAVRQIPNLITLMRILLILPIAVSLARGQFEATLVLFLIAASSDALDGFLARRFDWQSELGAILDPIADKLLLATVFISLTSIGLVPLWLMAAVLARDAVIVSGAVAYRIFIGPVAAHPSLISKLNTLCQAAFALLVVSGPVLTHPPPWAEIALGAVMFVTTALSGMDYVLNYARRALESAPTSSRSGSERQRA